MIYCIALGSKQRQLLAQKPEAETLQLAWKIESQGDMARKAVLFIHSLIHLFI
jgi:hypothetical protein